MLTVILIIAGLNAGKHLIDKHTQRIRYYSHEIMEK